MQDYAKVTEELFNNQKITDTLTSEKALFIQTNKAT